MLLISGPLRLFRIVSYQHLRPKTKQHQSRPYTEKPPPVDPNNPGPQGCACGGADEEARRTAPARSTDDQATHLRVWTSSYGLRQRRASPLMCSRCPRQTESARIKRTVGIGISSAAIAAPLEDEPQILATGSRFGGRSEVGILFSDH